jgi:hypothetical protein
MSTTSRSSLRWILILLACIAVSLICVIYPIYVIRPFRAQGAQELALALVVTRWRPLLTAISCIAALAAVFLYWRSGTRMWRRIVAVLGAGFVCVLAVLARINVYEHMFHPIDHADFAPAPRMKLDNDEKVIAVRVGSEPRAYPIRIMAYHHLINDVVDNLAIVATY